MFILPGALTSTVSRGYASLQVPELSVNFGESGVVFEEPSVEVPDEWFFYLKSLPKPRIAVGRESGFLHLSRVGFEANYDVLKAAFNPCRMSWAEFEATEEAVEGCSREQ